MLILMVGACTFQLSGALANTHWFTIYRIFDPGSSLCTASLVLSRSILTSNFEIGTSSSHERVWSHGILISILEGGVKDDQSQSNGILLHILS